MATEKNKTFLLQSKDPSTFNRVKFSNNVILGITYETSRSASINYSQISKAPAPSCRIPAFARIKHKQKIITIEPILDFYIPFVMCDILAINPCMVWIGYDSGKNNLPEPPIEKVRELSWELQKAGITVILKRMKNE